MERRLLILGTLLMLLFSPSLALRCSCDVVKPNGNTIGVCVDSTWTNSKGESIYNCCAPSLTYQGNDLSSLGFVQCTAVAQITTTSDAGTSVFSNASRVTGSQLTTCSSRNGHVCEINPSNGYTANGADTGKCDDDSNTCVTCNANRAESGRWTGGTTFVAGDQLCEDACGAISACDERPNSGTFADPKGDHTADSCSATCLSYTDSQICEFDYGASIECDGQVIGYYNGIGGCNSNCQWQHCGNYGWDASNRVCYGSCTSSGQCKAPAICTPSHTCVTDDVPPTILVSSPTNNAIYSSSPVTLQYQPTDDVDNQVQCFYTFDGTPSSVRVVTSGSYDMLTIPVVEGPHQLSVNCSDQAGNSAVSQNVQFTVDFGVPAYSAVARAPSGQVYHNDNVQLSCTWYDASGIGIVYARHNATGSWENYTTQQSSDVYSYTIPSNLLTNGQMVAWNLWARDSVGNWNASMPAQYFSVSNRIPSLPVLTAQPDSHNTTRMLSWSASTDADGDSISYQVRVGIAPSVDNLLNRTETSASTVLTSLSYGTTYNWSVRACDSTSACTAWTASDEFLVSNAVPAITSVSLTPVTAFNTSTMFCAPSGVSDPDGDSVSLTYNWYKNGGLLSVHTNYLDSSYSVKGDVLRCGVVPFDGISSGAQTDSLNVTIVDSPPTMPAGAGPQTTHTLSPVLSFVKGTDADDETVMTSICVRSSLPFGTTGCVFTSSTSSQAFSVNNLSYGGSSRSYYVRMWSQGSSNEYYDSYLNVTNAQPTAPSNGAVANLHDRTPLFTWTPGTDADGDLVQTVVCVGTASDYSDCSVVNTNTTAGSYEIPSTLAFGTPYYVKLVSRDGTGASNQDSSALQWSFTLSNAAPVISSTVFSADPFYYNDDITCIANVTDADGDSLVVRYYVYDSQGAGADYQGTANCAGSLCTASIPNVQGSKGQWRCTFDATDSYVLPVTGATAYSNMANSAPTAPGTIDPDRTHNPQPTIVWQASSDPNPEDVAGLVYYINITDAVTGSPVLATTYVGTAMSFATPSPLVFPHFYKIHVWAFDGTANSTVSSQNVDYHNNQPNVALTPVDDTHTLLANLSWAGSDADGDALSYDLQVSNDYVFNSIITWLNATSQTSYAQALGWDNGYYWRVRACDNSTATNNCTSWTAADDFWVINRAPTIPAVTDEPDDHSSTRTLHWNNSVTDADGDAFTFEVWVGTAPGSSDVYSESSILSTQSSIIIANLTAWDTPYYWSVRACDTTAASNQCSVWAAWDSFSRINAAPTQPQLSSPANGALPHATTVDMIWVSGTDADGDSTHDEFWFASDAIVNPATSPEQKSGLAWATAYTWRVRTCDDSGAPDACSAWVNFTFTPTNAQPTAPSDGEVSNDHVLMPSITWTPGADADGDSISTFVCVGTQSDYSDCSIADTTVVGGSYNIMTSLSYNQTYYVSLLSNDGTTAANANSTAYEWSFALANQAPTTTTPSISPSIAYRIDTLTCVPGMSSDADGDSMTLSYQWFKNGTTMSGMTSPVLGVGNYTKGDVLVCQVTPADAYSTGAPVNSTSVTILNKVPAVGAVWIVPDPAYVTSTLSCRNGTVTDYESDPVSLSYQWFKNGEEIGNQTAATLPSASFVKADTIVCEVTPSDSDAGLPVNSIGLVISNSVPAQPGIISPTLTHNPDLNLTWSASTDADSELITYYIKVSSTTGRTGDVSGGWQNTTDTYYPLGIVSFPHIYYVDIESKDSEETSTVQQGEVNVVNNAPSPFNLTSPVTEYQTTSTSVDLMWAGSYDADGDSILYYVDVNGMVDSTSSSSFTTGPHADGTYTWNVSACDNTTATNNCTSSASRTFTIDTTAPTGGSINYTDGYYAVTSVPITLVNGTDATTSIVATRVYRRSADLQAGGSCGTFSGWSVIATSPASPFTDDTVANQFCYQYQLQAVDALGWDTNYTSTSVVQVDTVKPSISGEAQSPAPGAVSPNVDVQLNATVTDNALLSSVWVEGDWASGVYANYSATSLGGDVYSFTIPSGDVNSHETINWRFWSNDSASNVQAGAPQIFTVQNVYPEVSSVMFNVSSFVYDAPIQCNATVKDNDGDDLTGHVSAKVWDSDSSESSPDYSFASVTCTGVQWKQGKTCTVVIPNVQGAKGAWNCSMTANDTRGGITTGYAATAATMMNTAPTAPSSLSPLETHELVEEYTFSKGSDVNPEDTVTSSVCVTDTGFATTGCMYESSGMAGTSFSTTGLTFGDANKTYYFRMWSNDGTDSSTFYDTHVYIVNAEPTATVPSAPANNSITTDDTPELSYTESTDADSDAVTYYIQVSSDPAFTAPTTDTSATTSFTTSALSDGTWYWRVSACDNTTAANQCTAYSDNFGLTVDTSAPTGMDVGFLGGYFATESVPVTGIVNGTDAHSGIQVNRLWRARGDLADGVCSGYDTVSALVATDSGSTFTDTSVLTDNCYTYVLESVNNAGLAANSSVSGEAKVDITAPVAGSTSYLDGLTMQVSQDVSVTNGTDAESGVASTLLWKQSAVLTTGSCGAYGTPSVLALSPASPVSDSMTAGNCYQYFVETFNRAESSTNSTISQTTQVDTQAPAYSDRSRTADPIYNDDDVVISATWTDAHSSVATVYARHNASGSWSNETPAQAGSVYSFTIPASQLENQETVAWNFWAVDAAGVWNNVMPEQYFFVQNRAPTLESASIENAIAFTNDTLTCANGTTADADGEGVALAYRWFNDSVLISGEEGQTLDGAHFEKGDKITCEITPNDGITSGSAVTSSILTISNAIPSIVSVSLAPIPAFTDDDVTCTPAGWSDIDGDAEGYQFVWYKNNSAVSGEASSVLASTNFGKDDSIICEATPDDGTAVGIAVNSSALVISNSAPSTTQPSIDQAVLYTDTDATCTNGTSSDVDGDSVTYSWKWFVNSIEVGGNSQTLSSSNFVKGDSVVCEATPNDGTADGTAVSSDAKIVQNVGPVAGTVALTPDPGYETSNMTCTPSGFTDIDGDGLTYNYTWYVNSSVVSGQTGSSLLGDYFSKTDIIECQASVYDGTAYSGESGKSNAVTISNTAPTIGAATLSPDPAYQTSGVLTCSAGATSDADSDSVSVYYTWYLNSSIISGQSASTLSNSTFAKDDSIYCETTPFDGVVNGTADSSNAVTIANSAPASPTSLSPTNGATVGTDVTMSWTSGVDPDADSVSDTWEWCDNDFSCSAPSESVSGITTRDKTGLGLGTYYWQVKSSDGLLDSSWVRYSFTVA